VRESSGVAQDLIRVQESGSLASDPVGEEIQLRQRSDWKELGRNCLTTVLDPMVFRAGELFLRAAAEPEPTCRLPRHGSR